VRRRARRRDLESPTWALALLGRALRADEQSNALRFLDRQARAIGAFFTRYDLLLTPTLAQPPFAIHALQPSRAERLLLQTLGSIGSGKLIRWLDLLDRLAGEVFQAIPYTPVFNVTGQPAMSVPLWWNGAGLPVGVHLVGRFAEEATLFRIAGQLERARPWADRVPSVARVPVPQAASRT
jgi:amidase